MYLSARAWRELQGRLTDDSVIILNVITLALVSRAIKSTYISNKESDPI